ncbi:5027_t:CDS:1, partial [Entrophospora sp. SA101]
MAQIHTLYSESTDAKNFQGHQYKLDSTRECELESQCNELLVETEFFANKCSEFRNAKTLAETRSDGLAKELKSKNKKILHLQKKLNRITNAKTRNDSNMKQLKEEIKQLQSKNTNLVSQGALKELSLTGYQTKYYKKMEEANSFQSRIKSLEEKLFSAQKDSSLKASGIDSL